MDMCAPNAGCHLLQFVYLGGVEPSQLILQPFTGLTYQPWKIDGAEYGAISGMIEWQEKPK
jgi:hypothetical protein